MPEGSVKLLATEKKSIVDFIKAKQNDILSRVSVLEKEHVLLVKCVDSPPSGTRPEYIAALRAKAEEWMTNVLKIQSSADRYARFIAEVESSTGFKIGTDTFKHELISDMYSRERSTRKANLEPKYKYYPRLKRAKEASIYVLAEKLKTILENKHVQAA